MGFRDRVLRWLDRGDSPPDPAPDAPVEVENVRLVDGPMVVAHLKEAGIEAHGVESYRSVGERVVPDRMRIIVRYRDAERAVAIVAEHLRQIRG